MELRVYIHFLIFDMIKFQVVIRQYMEPSRLLSALSSRANDSTILCLIVYIPKPCHCVVGLERAGINNDVSYFMCICRRVVSLEIRPR